MSSRLIITLLGSGSSGGVPRFGGADGCGDWGDCDPHEPRNHRTRCSLLVRRGVADTDDPHKMTTVLVDTSPDMRQQLLAARCARLDAVLYTHNHADQVHGIDDLRVFALQMQKRVPVFMDDLTATGLLRRFDYCFQQAPGSYYPPILEAMDMPPCGEPFELSGPGGEVPCLAFLQHHGAIDSLGFRFGDVAYSSDVVDLPEESFAALEGVKVWIVDALQLKPHKTHAHLAKTLGWIERVKPKRAILTNMHIHMDYQTLRKSLPEGVEPGFDGLTIEMDLEKA